MWIQIDMKLDGGTLKDILIVLGIGLLILFINVGISISIVWLISLAFGKITGFGAFVAVWTVFLTSVLIKAIERRE